MQMSRKIWLVLAIVALLAASFAASVVAARRAKEDRTKYVTRGLDYLHARQGDNGGFGTPRNTAWAVLGAVASGERMGNSAWHVKGKNPFDYLQATDLVSSVDGNAPVYYAQLMMTYTAMGRTESIGSAGSKRVNLTDLLLSYQDWGDTSAKTGAFAPSKPLMTQAVPTTAWAICALANAGYSLTSERYVAAQSWLADQQNADGGFPTSEAGGASTAPNTALAIQALKGTAAGLNWDRDAAEAYLRAHQLSSGGFSAGGKGDTTTDAEATSAAIQAILSLGQKPRAWTYGSTTRTPLTALQALLHKNGSYNLTRKLRVRPIHVTGWALTALREKTFSDYPESIGRAHVAFRFRPVFKVVSPKNGAKFTHTRVVLIRATYTDFSPKGTGIDPKTSKLFVDDANKSRPADIGHYGLHLQLKNVPNGEHKYRVELHDYAGNTKVIERKFTVNVTTPTPPPTIQPTVRPTYIPQPGPTVTVPSTTRPTSVPTSVPTTVPTSTPTTYPSYTPTATATPIISGSPIASPSASPSPSGAGGSGGGSAAGFVGGTLLAMLPIGAVVSYLLLHRREELLGAASQGEVLSGGGSTWQRFKQTLARSKDLTRPSSRE